MIANLDQQLHVSKCWRELLLWILKLFINYIPNNDCIFILFAIYTLILLWILIKEVGKTDLNAVKRHPHPQAKLQPQAQSQPQ